ncbi:hypothetical protein [Sphingosinicella sp. YJ22]|uniref:hypothetical protein n=1 Tax=Sphingosinicella sp. YJ22 TaxID=1104780 RepID=UPI00140CEAFF|nr:hypothetical protein [Sphingosinicella sp. YJ22]
MRLRLPALCLGLVAVPALAGLAADARACSRHGERSGQLSLVSLDQSQAPPRASGSLRVTVGAAFPL